MASYAVKKRTDGKKKGKIEANGIGEYRICKQSVEPVKKGRMEFSNKQKNQLEVSIGNIEMYVDKYKKLNLYEIIIPLTKKKRRLPIKQ